MMFSLKVVAVSSVLLRNPLAQAARLYDKPCPLVDAYFPAPSRLAGSPRIASAVDATMAGIQSVLDGNSQYGQFDVNSTALSLQVYSIHEDAPLVTYHRTPALLASRHTSGVGQVGSDTIYRIGSVSKLWTVFIYLVAAGDESWNDPITDHVPELAAIAERRGRAEGDADHVDWTTVTIGALASHTAGIGRDAAFSGELGETLEQFGIPNPGFNAHSACGDAARLLVPCNRTAFFEDFPRQHPVFPSFKSPVYTNAGFQILGYALEAITGESMADLFRRYLVDALKLEGTYFTVPPASATPRGIIPYNTTASYWDADARDETVAGGYFSTIDDMRKIGGSMLRSAQLPPSQTRRWMQPRAFLSDPSAAVGAPWEILRAGAALADPPQWLYTKSGDLGMYASVVALLPDLDVGFSVLAAGDDAVAAARLVGDVLVDSWLPALRGAAADEAERVFAGRYADEDSHSTLVVVDGRAGPAAAAGLAVSEWTYGGTDVLDLLGQILGVDQGGTNLTVRLYPTGLSRSPCGHGARQVAWRAVFEALPQRLDPGSFSSNCAAWQSVDGLTYGGVGFDEFLFTVDEASGRAVGAEARVLSQKLAVPAQRTRVRMRRTA